MVKLIVSLFLLFNLALLDSCDSPTPSKKSDPVVEQKASPKLEPIEKAKSPEKTPTPQATETTTKSKDNKTQTPEVVAKNNSNKSIPAPSPVPVPKTEVDQSSSVYHAIDIVLGRKPASGEEKNNALKVVKKVLSVKELKNARSKRNDPNLLKDLYPKNKELKVGTKNQIVFWNAYDRAHFAARHLIDYFDTKDIKGKNSWWPAGTTQEQIDRYLQMTLEAYSAKISLPNPGSTGSDFKYFDFDLPDKSKIRVSVGIQSDGRVTSFFPKTGQNVITLSEGDVQKLLTAAGK
ncbi:MAG: hypothetical protein FD167_1995 [bacterium]|nr:MAG: hypothetical protein FD167_1995 [bacterium]